MKVSSASADTITNIIDEQEPPVLSLPSTRDTSGQGSSVNIFEDVLIKETKTRQTLHSSTKTEGHEDVELRDAAAGKNNHEHMNTEKHSDLEIMSEMEKYEDMEVGELRMGSNTAGLDEHEDREEVTSDLEQLISTSTASHEIVNVASASKGDEDTGRKSSIKGLLFSLLLVVEKLLCFLLSWHILQMLVLLLLMYWPILNQGLYSSASDTLRKFSRPRNCNIYHECLSLPNIANKRVGRNTEIQEIIKQLSHPDVQVFNIHGDFGIGKSSVAIHIGHHYQTEGKVVYYVSVENLQVDTIVDLFSTGKNDEKISLQGWAQSQKNETLIILDNMDSPHWNGRVLKEKFIKVLETNRNIKILITSYMQIIPTFYHLNRSNETNCISLLQARTITSNISYGHAGAICCLTKSIPSVIKLISNILLSDVYSVEQVIARMVVNFEVDCLNKYGLEVSRITRIMQVMWLRGCDQSPCSQSSLYSDTLYPIPAAIDLSFTFVSRKCYSISILLGKLRSFTMDMVKHFITDEMKQHLSRTPFDVEDCIYQLYNRSLLEEHSIFGQFGHQFPIDVKCYLEYRKLDDDILLKMFWKNRYFQQNLRIACGGLDCGLVGTIWTWMPRMPKLNDEDVVYLTEFMPNFNHELVLHMLDGKSISKVEYKNSAKKLRRAIERLNCAFPKLKGSHFHLLLNLYDNYTTCEVSKTIDKPKTYDLLFTCFIWDRYNENYSCNRIYNYYVTKN